MERNEDSAGQNTSSRINKAVFPSGLTEPDPLGIGKNLVHVFQLPRFASEAVIWNLPEGE